VKRGWFSQRALGRFDIRKQFFIGEQMPDGSGVALGYWIYGWIYGDYAQQAEAAFKLKD